MTARGLFITVEGGDRAGKSTQFEYLRQALEAVGASVVLTREPGGTPLGQRIRDLLLHDETLPPLDPRTELLLLAADRAQHVASIIRPALANACVVVSDRYLDSTVAYQGYGLGLDAEEIRQINAVATAGLMPDVTFLLDLPVELRRQRRQTGPRDHIDSRSEDFHQRVREGFLAIAARHPERIVVIDASRSAAEVQVQLQAALRERVFPKLGLTRMPEEGRL